MSHGSKFAALALTSALALSLAAPTLAQDANESTGDIIVTARRVEERLQDVPISITVFSEQQLANRNVVNAQDLASYTPSLSVSTNFGSDNTSFAIRGFVQDTGTQPSVGVYFADVVSPRAGISSGIQSGDGAGPGSFFDLQNVQVLKGPQGTLFGRNTTGGAILFVPQKPTGQLEGYVEAGVGNYDQRRLQAVLNVPLADTFRARLAVDRQKRDGFQKNDTGIGPKDFADINYVAVRASIVADLTPNLENYTIASYLNSDTNSSIQAVIGCDPNPAGLGGLACAQIAASQAKGRGFYTVQNAVADPYSTIKQWQVVNTTTWLASDTLTIKNIVSYAELRNDIRTDYGGTAFNLGAGNPVIFSTIMSPPGSDIASQSTFTEELQFQGKSADGKLNWQAGGYYEFSGALGDSGIASPVFLSCAGGSSDGLNCSDPLGIGTTQALGFPVNVGSVSSSLGRTNLRNVGVYAQSTYSFTDQFSVTGGLRYTWDRQNSVNHRLSYLFPVTPPYTQAPVSVCFDESTVANNCTYSASQKSSKPTWLISLEYKPYNDLLLYTKYARGYRSGGVFPNSPTNYRTFQPEKVDAYEAGLKWTFRGATPGHLNIAGFYNDFANQQVFVGFTAAPGSSAPPTTGIVNAGKSRIYGVEADASISPFTGLNLDGGYTYLNATIRKIVPLISTDPKYALSAPILPGNPLLLSPKHKLTATATYTLPLDESAGRVSFGATVSYSSKQLSSYDFNNEALLAVYGGNLTLLPQRTLVNLNLNWKSVAGSPVDLGLFATNVTKKKYHTYVPSFGTLGFFTGTLGEPRMYGMRLRYSFGN